MATTDHGNNYLLLNLQLIEGYEYSTETSATNSQLAAWPCYQRELLLFKPLHAHSCPVLALAFALAQDILHLLNGFAQRWAISVSRLLTSTGSRPISPRRVPTMTHCCQLGTAATFHLDCLLGQTNTFEAYPKKTRQRLRSPCPVWGGPGARSQSPLPARLQSFTTSVWLTLHRSITFWKLMYGAGRCFQALDVEDETREVQHHGVRVPQALHVNRCASSFLL